MSNYEEYAKQRGYAPDSKYEDRYKGHATYNATVDLNAKMDRVADLLYRLVELEEARAIKEGYMVKSRSAEEAAAAKEKRKNRVPGGAPLQ